MFKRFFFPLLSMIILLPACDKHQVKGSGNVITQERAIAGFTKVRLSGSTNIHINQGNDFSVKVKGYENLLPHFETSVANAELFLGYSNNLKVMNDNIEVFVTMPSLTGLTISGSGAIDVNGDFGTSQNLDVEMSGSGTITVQEMEPQNLNATIGGSGRLFLFGVLCANANVSIAGSGEAEVSVITKLHARISGSGTVFYKGHPVVETEISGSGRVIEQ